MKLPRRTFLHLAAGAAALPAFQSIAKGQSYPSRPITLIVFVPAGGAPDIPTIAEAGVPGYEAVQWFGVLAPAGTPRDIVSRLHKEVVRTVQTPDIRQKLVNDGADPVGSLPEEFAAFIRSETAKWAKVAKAIGLKPE